MEKIIEKLTDNPTGRYYAVKDITLDIAQNIHKYDEMLYINTDGEKLIQVTKPEYDRLTVEILFEGMYKDIIENIKMAMASSYARLFDLGYNVAIKRNKITIVFFSNLFKKIAMSNLNTGTSAGLTELLNADYYIATSQMFDNVVVEEDTYTQELEKSNKGMRITSLKYDDNTFEIYYSSKVEDAKVTTGTYHITEMNMEKFEFRVKNIKKASKELEKLKDLSKLFNLRNQQSELVDKIIKYTEKIINYNIDQED